MQAVAALYERLRRAEGRHLEDIKLLTDGHRESLRLLIGEATAAVAPFLTATHADAQDQNAEKRCSMRESMPEASAVAETTQEPDAVVPPQPAPMCMSPTPPKMPKDKRRQSKSNPSSPSPAPKRSRAVRPTAGPAVQLAAGSSMQEPETARQDGSEPSARQAEHGTAAAPTLKPRATRSRQAAQSRTLGAQQPTRKQPRQQQQQEEPAVAQVVDPSQPQVEQPQQEPSMPDLHGAHDAWQQQDPSSLAAGSNADPAASGAPGQQHATASVNLASGTPPQQQQQEQEQEQAGAAADTAAPAADDGGGGGDKPKRQSSRAKRTTGAPAKQQKAAAARTAVAKTRTAAAPAAPVHEPPPTSKPASPAKQQTMLEPEPPCSDVKAGAPAGPGAAATHPTAPDAAPAAPAMQARACSTPPPSLSAHRPSLSQGQPQPEAPSVVAAPPVLGSTGRNTQPTMSPPAGAAATAMDMASPGPTAKVPGAVCPAVDSAGTAAEVAGGRAEAAGSGGRAEAATSVVAALESAAEGEQPPEPAGLVDTRSSPTAATPGGKGLASSSALPASAAAAPVPSGSTPAACSHAAAAGSPEAALGPSPAALAPGSQTATECSHSTPAARASSVLPPALHIRGSALGQGVAASPSPPPSCLSLPAASHPCTHQPAAAAASPASLAAADAPPSPPAHASPRATPLQPHCQASAAALEGPRLRDLSFGGFMLACEAGMEEGVEHRQAGTPAMQVSVPVLQAQDERQPLGMAGSAGSVHSAFGSPQPVRMSCGPEASPGGRGTCVEAEPAPALQAPADGGAEEGAAAGADTDMEVDEAGPPDGGAAAALAPGAPGGSGKAAAAAGGSNLVAAVRSFLPAKRVLSPQIAAGKKQVKVRALEAAQAAKRAEEAKAADRVRAKEEQSLKQQQQQQQHVALAEAGLFSPVPVRPGAAGGGLVKLRAAAIQQRMADEEAGVAEDASKKQDRDREAAGAKAARRQVGGGAPPQPGSAPADKQQLFSNVRLQPFGLQGADRGKRPEQGPAALGHAAAALSSQQQQRPDVNDKLKRAETRRKEEEERRRVELETKQRIKGDRTKAAKLQLQQQQQHVPSRREGGKEAAAAPAVHAEGASTAAAVGADPSCGAAAAAAAADGSRRPLAAQGPAGGAGAGAALQPRSLNIPSAAPAGGAMARAAGMDAKAGGAQACVGASSVVTPIFKSDKAGAAGGQLLGLAPSAVRPGLLAAAAASAFQQQAPMTPAEMAEEQRNIHMLVTSPYVTAGNARTPGLRAGATNQVLSYEISPYRSDSDDEDCDLNASRKPVPEWAQAGNLMVQLQKQQLVDPDHLFGTKMKTCPLEVIFEGVSALPPPDTAKASKRRDWRKRGSTGDWLKDRLTWQEEINYKKSMGYYQ